MFPWNLEADSEVPAKRVKEYPDWRKEEDEDEEITRRREWEGRKGGEITSNPKHMGYQQGRETRRRKRRKDDVAQGNIYEKGWALEFQPRDVIALAGYTDLLGY